MVKGMVKQKVTISLDREQLDVARELTGITSTSATIDRALAELIRAERLHRDVLAYTATPPTSEEMTLARGTASWSDLADDTDWESLYADGAEAAS
jgi:hypothetical protein